jgi:hypothetical protein
MTGSATTYIAVNPVRADRADDFEQWLRTVVAPATRELQPDLYDQWHVLRSTGAADGVVTFVFQFDGGTPEDWDLVALLERALGQEGAERAFAEVEGMMTAPQEGWWVAPVRLAEA